MSRIYVASSWRCADQPAAVQALRQAGHEVYDFRNPRPGDHGFAWSALDPEWIDWTPEAYRRHLDDQVAVAGYESDFDAMQWADTFVLVLPCGRSAHLELGWAAGQGKRTAILLSPNGFEPELMYRMVDLLATDLSEVIDWLQEPDQAERHATTCDLLVGRGLRICNCRPAGDPGAVREADPYERSADR